MERGRNYHRDTDEYGHRREIFRRRLDLITLHNSKETRLWTAGLNELTDRTEDELSQLRGWRRAGGPVGHTGLAVASLLAQSATVIEEPAEFVDWRSLSMAAEVPNQGACGSCWAVATAAMLQGRHEVQLKSNRSFSSQQLVNCVPNPHACGGEGGCNGATVELAMSYVESMGLANEEHDPYIGSDMTCKQPLTKHGGSATASFLAAAKKQHGSGRLGLQSWHKLPENKALPLMLAVAEGPVAVSVGADEWTLYSNGIFDGCSRDAVIDHAVVLFGYGKGTHGIEKGNNYWLVRNSWGGHWGEHGFIRLLRQSTVSEEDAHCGTDHDPKAGVACKPYPAKVQVCGQCGILYDSVSAHFVQPSVQY